MTRIIRVPQRRGEGDDVSSQVKKEQDPAKGEELSAGAFRSLVDAFQRIRVPVAGRAGEGSQAAAEQRREDIKALIESHVTDAKWRALMHEAREAAERGEHEYLLLRFPAHDCTDHGRAIIQQEARWPETLTGDAGTLYRHWHQELRSRGFELAARILEFPGGLPGDAGLFLTWKS
jgi:hypothetical protein